MRRGIQNAIRIAAIDDHASVHEYLGWMAATEDDLDFVGSAWTAEEGVEMVKRLSPDVVLVDLRLPRDGKSKPDTIGAELTTCLAQSSPDARVLLLSGFANYLEVQAALDAGARGFVHKGESLRVLATAIRRIDCGDVYVSSAAVQVYPMGRQTPTFGATQTNILRAFARGLSDEEIAARVFKSRLTVRNHILDAIRRLQLLNRTQLMRWVLTNWR